MKYRKDYETMIRAVPGTGIDERTKVLLKDFGKYFKMYPDSEVIDKRTFATHFFTTWHPKLDTEVKQNYAKVISNAEKDVPGEIRDNLVNTMLEVSYAMQAADLLQRYDDGADVDIVNEVKELTEKVYQQRERRLKIPFVDDPIEDLLEEDLNDDGLHWRLDTLNESMRPLRPGDFGVIAGRPDTGKTSFLTSELSFMAPQLETYYGRKRPIVWFNNEGPGGRIKKRVYQSALGYTLDEMLEAKKDGTIVEKYIEKVGHLNAIHIIDIHELWSYDIVDILERIDPGLVVFDMIDNIKFKGDLGGKSRTDEVLEAQYQWARLLGVKYNCPVLATSQISNDGDGELWPTLGMLKDSKTGKQGASDFQLMLGASHAMGYENIRGIGLVKNKLHRAGFPKDPKESVMFRGETGRYERATGDDDE